MADVHDFRWISCQLGAREHYAVPRALYRAGLLDTLLTDAWLQPRSVLGRLNPALRERFHSDLSHARVRAWTVSLLQFEVAARVRSLTGWPRTIERNRWFQHKLLSFLSTHESQSVSVLFSGSYTAVEPFRFAKRQGWRTVLGQIDSGPAEEEIVAREAARVPQIARRWERAPAEYWSAWREECALADEIIVNSPWSRTALMVAGVPDEKLRVVPLAYESATDSQTPPITRRYPSRFTSERPLRVLFLGQINLRKGAARVFEAIRLLATEPIEFEFVGQLRVAVPQDLTQDRRVRWFGSVPRSKTADFYRQADVLLFPTLSDGFGLTQLEAMAHKLPVIASRYCGEVVIHEQNGVLLEEPSAEAIAAALRACVRDSQRLSHYSECARVDEKFTIARVGEQLARQGGAAARE